MTDVPRTASALVAAYNEARHIDACLGSLRAQTFAPLEIIVADDGSTDDTARRATAHGVRVLRLPHAGKARALNAAAQAATGAVLLLLDADLVFQPGYVEALVRPILDGRALGTSHGTERVANPANVWSACWQDRAGLPRDVRVRATKEEMAAGSTIFRAVLRERFLAVGGFDDTGFLDDQTLAPKLSARAMLVAEAECAHFNADRLDEVFASGRWGGKSIAVRHPGWGAALRYLPPLAAGRALLSALRTMSPARLIYDAVYDTGVWTGVMALRLGVEEHRGK
ncbi:MAG TPA: glycosyltransferase [Gemmatimonadales bacterium]